MIKIIDIPFKIRRKINVFFTNIYVNKKFYNREKANNYEFVEKENILSELVYKDDSWNYISNLIKYMEYVYKKKNFFLEDNKILNNRFEKKGDILRINSAPKDNNWICFFYNPKKKSYKLEYEFITYSSLEEIQVAFKCKNLGERYRFMIHNNKEAVFECVHRGVFYLNIFKKIFKIYKGKKYRVTLIVNENTFEYYINEKLIYSIVEDGSLINGDDVIIIFYNKESKDGVNVDLLNCNISYMN